MKFTAGRSFCRGLAGVLVVAATMSAGCNQASEPSPSQESTRPLVVRSPLETIAADAQPDVQYESDGFPSPSAYERIRFSHDVLVAVGGEAGSPPVFLVRRSLLNLCDAAEIRPPAGIVGDVSPGETCLVFVERSQQGTWTANGVWTDRVASADPTSQPTLAVAELLAAIARLRDPDLERATLLALLDAARHEPGRFPPGTAWWALQHFTQPSRHKSFAELHELHELGDAARRFAATLAIAQADGYPAPDFFRREARGGAWPAGLLPWIKTSRQPAAFDVGLELWRDFPDRRQQLTVALVERATPRDTAGMLELLRAVDVETPEAALVARWFTLNYAPEAVTIMNDRVGPAHQSARGFFPALACIGDGDVVRWASRRVWSDAEADSRLAVTVVAVSPRDDADHMLRDVIAHGDRDHRRQIAAAVIGQPGPDRTNPDYPGRL